MEIKLSEEYEDLATEWQYQMIVMLKDKLAKFGVEDNKAKEIIGEFAFDFAMLHDQEEIKFEGKSYKPVISFNDLTTNLIVTDEESNLHEYAFGSTSEAFGE